MPKKTTGDRPELNPINVGAAAVDIGSKIHMAAVNPACTDVSTLVRHLYTRPAWSGGMV
jgi:transposase